MKLVRTTAIALLLVATAGARAQGPERTVEMQVDGLVCGFCAQGIRKNLATQASIEDVLVDLERGMVAIALREGQDIDDETLRRSLEKSGFALRNVRRTSETLAELRSRLDASVP
jgi:mercuric ion binding protein